MEEQINKAFEQFGDHMHEYVTRKDLKAILLALATKPEPSDEPKDE
jgi:hypothetical protein